MPDVKASAAPCDLPPAATPPPGYSMDLERCLPDLQAFPHHHHHHHPGSPHAHAPYPTLEAPSLGQCPPSSLLGSLGLRYCSSSSMGPPSSPRHNPGDGGGTPPSPRARQQQQQQQQAFRAYVNTTNSSSSSSSRLYRSMENLNWAVSDPSLYALSGVPYRSVDSEFILHCTSTTSHWYDSGSHSEDDGGGIGGQFHDSCSPPNPESLAFYPRRALARRDLPQLFPPWMFPAAGGMEEWAANGNGRKGLRDKLRMQSARTAEPLKPLRPQVAPGNGVPVSGPPYVSGGWGWEKDLGGPRHLCPPSPRSLSARRITSPEEIKQEVLRRLQLRRQNSSPNLAMHDTPAAAPPQEPQNGNMSRSFTSEPLGGSGGGGGYGGGGGGGSSHSTPERKRPPMGRLHIPTFEEFKRMRQRESGHSQPVAPTAPSSGENGNCSQSENNSSCAQSGEQGASDEQDGQPSSNQNMETDQDHEDKVKDEDNNEGTITGTTKSDAAAKKHTQENIAAQTESRTQSQDQTACQTPELPLEAPSSASLTPATPTPTPPSSSSSSSSSSSTTSSAPATTTAPICTGPAPRSPLPSTSAPPYGHSGNNNNSSNRGSSSGGGIRGSNADGVTEPSSSSSTPASASASGPGTGDEPLGGPFPPPRKESGEAPSSCCPALLLEGADLSSYGAKIYSMRDGLLGSALDLIKKR